MLQHKATLIQDIQEYLSIIQWHVRFFLREHHFLAGITEEDAIKWIIAEELELIFGLFTKDHMHNRVPYSEIHSKLNNALPTSLSTLTSAFIRAPKLYGENEITLMIKERDLYIQYFAHHNNFRYPLSR